MTNASTFAYVADGRNGLRVLQLTSPARTEGLWGFSPEPEPELIATFKTKGEAIALSKGLDRDRAVDESGNQLAVFGRRGARPFRLDEMQKLYMRNGQALHRHQHSSREAAMKYSDRLLPDGRGSDMSAVRISCCSSSSPSRSPPSLPCAPNCATV